MSKAPDQRLEPLAGLRNIPTRQKAGIAMNDYTTKRPPGAIAAGAFFACVTAYVLFEDVVRHGAPITTKHVMTLAVLVGTIYFGHKFWPQLTSWKIPTALGCGVLFLAGTYMCVVMAAGRNAEVIQAKNADARKSNDGRGRVEAEVEAAKADRDRAKAQHQAAIDAQADADTAMRAACSAKEKGARTRCRSTSDASKLAADRVTQAATSATRADEHYWQLYGQFANLPAAKVENGDLKALAAVYVKLPWVQASAESIEAAHVLMLPIGMALFAEIGLIVALSIRERRPVKVVIPANQETPDAGDGGEPAELSERPVSPPPSKGRPMTRLEAEQWLVTQLALGRELPSQDWMREQCGLSKATAHDWVQEWRRRGLVETVRSGRCNLIRAGRKLQSA